MLGQLKKEKQMISDPILQKLAMLSIHCPFLECDGFSRVVAYTLKEAGIPYTCWVGSVFRGGDLLFRPHFWVSAEGYILDYRLLMWIGEGGTTPHGCFLPSDYPDFTYEGQETNLDITLGIYQILTLDNSLEK